MDPQASSKQHQFGAPRTFAPWTSNGLPLAPQDGSRGASILHTPFPRVVPDGPVPNACHGECNSFYAVAPDCEDVGSRCVDSQGTWKGALLRRAIVCAAPEEKLVKPIVGKAMAPAKAGELTS